MEHINLDEVPLLIETMPLLYRAVVADFHKKDFGFSKSQLLVFLVLRSCRTLTMTQTAEYLSSSKEQATRAVAPLVDCNYVERYMDPENRTKVLIRLTSEGEAFIDGQLRKYYAHLSESLDDRLTASEKQELEQSLRSINRLMRKLLEG